MQKNKDGEKSRQMRSRKGEKKQTRGFQKIKMTRQRCMCGIGKGYE